MMQWFRQWYRMRRAPEDPSVGDGSMLQEKYEFIVLAVSHWVVRQKVVVKTSVGSWIGWWVGS